MDINCGNRSPEFETGSASRLEHNRSRTESLCPVCLRRLPAKRVHQDDTVYLVKHCLLHGEFRTPIWRGEPAFEHWQRPKIPVRPPAVFTDVEKGCPFDCGLCGDHRQRSCTVLIEVTQRCDLACPVCFAAAPSKRPDPSLDAIGRLLRKAGEAGPGCNIQLSGGEPTMRDDLPDIVALGREMGFPFIQVNTNGLRLGRDRAYVKALQQAGLASVFLQFDGTEEDIYQHLRGRALFKEKVAAVEACAEHKIGVVLVPTLVPGVNVHNIGAILQAALDWMPFVRGVHFQPVSYFGRYPVAPDDASRITLPEVLQAIEEQSGGRFQLSHCGPPGCENALCSFHGQFMLLPDGKVLPLKSVEGGACCAAPIKADEGAAKAITSVARQWTGRETPWQVAEPDQGCRCQEAGNSPGDSVSIAPMSLDAFIQRARTHTFSISAMAFQDAWNVALDRVRDCCIHVMAPDGRLIPFCLYNLTAADGGRLYRE
jgi:7,8-dihydro-6-hydroxymethylpterin dimethyltransferase